MMNAFDNLLAFRTFCSSEHYLVVVLLLVSIACYVWATFLPYSVLAFSLCCSKQMTPTWSRK